MLETLDQIEWKSLGHAYGPAEDVPDLIRDLTSLDEKVRRTAWSSLYSNIYHQGTICEAAARAVPFLLELLEYESVPDRHQILIYLVHLANGTSYFEEFDLDEEFYEGVKFNRDNDWVKETHLAVRKGIPVYTQLLNHPNAKIRNAAAYVLGEIGEQTEEVRSQLRSLLQTEKDEVVKASILLSLGDLRDKHPQTITLMNQFIQTNYSLLGITSALAILRLDPGHLKAIQLLVDTLKNPDDTITSLFDQLPWREYGLSAEIFLCLGRLPENQIIPFIPDLVGVFQKSDVGCLTFMRVLLFIVFRKQETKLTFSDLTKEQILVLQAMTEVEPIWEYADTTLSLERYGLPYFNNREELKDFLAEVG
ncbi:HEAT repeat domain-containing protein [Thermoflavimicrobium daqui]|uniref:HEAT repeat domain-containing protein n=1 Tax=Thermoflavimicrobium daqui TaxID=2137476 RepID=A0A364K483_9BACL|nr:HEAT repeat domain-containing protein [Thermoflavimicrobium daqui]RAL24198.1 hypothetical protein DL897_10995 [Thermoflavimicrobium daqui]